MPLIDDRNLAVSIEISQRVVGILRYEIVPLVVALGELLLKQPFKHREQRIKETVRVQKHDRFPMRVELF